MTDKIKEILDRALKTFCLTTLATILVAIPEIVELIPMGWEAIKPVLVSASVGALAAGLSAVNNGVVKPLLAKVKNKGNGGEESVDESE